ncbi:PA2169 family four-helix-bundle protein [Skermanella mucosa]|uniref:ferritin-like domain-containing protein n=1 Tax=Skermanella mucosa TaxID=1789672 RepID=UPI00192B250E|nr:PA2169 family four-helix-bundle protein [Skermanella mucosa]UEM21753.1 PA2169 family four-helix-bundle protein [Skermanella mucosa]
MTKDEIVDTLNDLIQITEDSHEGYRKSAEDAQDPDLKTLFNDLSAQRGAMVRDLQKHVAEQGGAPEASGTMLGGAHRFFVDLKSAVMGRDRAAIIQEVERGETEAVRRYEQALDKDLPTHLASVISQHLARLRSDRDRLAAVKQGSKQAS